MLRFVHVLPDYIELSCRTPALALDPVPSPLSASPGACARCSGLDWSMLAGGSALFSGILKNYNLISTVEFSESGRQPHIGGITAVLAFVCAESDGRFRCSMLAYDMSCYVRLLRLVLAVACSCGQSSILLSRS